MRRRNGRFGWRAAMIGLVLLAAGAPAQEDPEAQFLNELTEAYVTFGRANRAREAQAWDEALQLYKDALAQYRRLHNLYPDRQAEIVQYRMADCANQVESLRRRAGRKKGKAPRAAEEEPEPLWRERYQTLLKENQYLHERLVELEEPAIAPAAVETPAEARPDFEQERARLTAEAEALRTKAAQHAEAARAAQEGREQQAAEAARQLTEAREEIERLQEKRKDAGAQLARTKKERDELKDRLQSLTTEIETARQRLEAEQSAEAAARAQAQQAEQEQKKLREEAEAQLTEARRERDARREKLEESEQRLAAEQATAKSLRVELENEKEAAQKLRAKLDKESEQVRDSKEALKQNRELSERVQSLAAELETARQRLAAEQISAESLRAQLEKDKKAAQEVKTRLAVEKKNADEQAARLHGALQETESLRATLDGEHAAALAAQEALERERTAGRAQKKSLEETEARLRTLEKANADLAGEADALKKRMAELAASPEVFQPVPMRAAAPAVPVPDIVSRAVALEKKGELEPALALYGLAARQAPGRPDVVNGEARCLLKLGRSDEGVAILRPVVARGTGEPEARLLLGIGLCALRQYREATEVLRAATPADPRSAALRNALGVAWIGLGNLDEARTELEQAVALDSLMGDAHMNLALVLAAGTGADREAARRHYRRALELGAAPESRLAESLGRR